MECPLSAKAGFPLTWTGESPWWTELAQSQDTFMYLLNAIFDVVVCVHVYICVYK